MIFLTTKDAFPIKDTGCIEKCMQFIESGLEKAGIAVFTAMATGNFIFELGLNIVLSPVVVRLLNIRNKK